MLSIAIASCYLQPQCGVHLLTIGQIVFVKIKFSVFLFGEEDRGNLIFSPKSAFIGSNTTLSEISGLRQMLRCVSDRQFLRVILKREKKIKI